MNQELLLIRIENFQSTFLQITGFWLPLLGFILIKSDWLYYFCHKGGSILFIIHLFKLTLILSISCHRKIRKNHRDFASLSPPFSLPSPFYVVTHDEWDPEAKRLFKISSSVKNTAHIVPYYSLGTNNCFLRIMSFMLCFPMFSFFVWIVWKSSIGPFLLFQWIIVHTLVLNYHLCSCPLKRCNLLFVPGIL